MRGGTFDISPAEQADLREGLIVTAISESLIHQYKYKGNCELTDFLLGLLNNLLECAWLASLSRSET